MTTKTPKPNVFADPWFAAFTFLLGLIIGYVIAGFTQTPAVIQVADSPAPSVAAPSVPSEPTPPAPTEVTAPDDSDRLRGEKDAEITLIEYSDFQCPFCTRHHPTMQALVDNNNGNVNWTIRHLPLRSIHPQAQKAAEAAECAGDLGGDEAYWTITDLMFERGVTGDFSAFAADVNIDAAAFVDCINTGKFASKVDRDLETAAAAGVRGTPGTIVYNNKTKQSSVISGARSVADFQQAIDSLLN